MRSALHSRVTRERQARGLLSIHCKDNFCCKLVLIHEDHREKDINSELSIPTIKLNPTVSLYQLVWKLNIHCAKAREAQWSTPGKAGCVVQGKLGHGLSQEPTSWASCLQSCILTGDHTMEPQCTGHEMHQNYTGKGEGTLRAIWSTLCPSSGKTPSLQWTGDRVSLQQQSGRGRLAPCKDCTFNLHRVLIVALNCGIRARG